MGGHWHVSKIALFHFRVCILLYLEYVRNRYGVFVGYLWDIRGVFVEYSVGIHGVFMGYTYVSGMCRESVGTNGMRGGSSLYSVHDNLHNEYIINNLNQPKST